MDRLRAGVALYNTGNYLAAHEPLESKWLEAPAGERDECLQGLIQATAAVYKSRIGNHSGAAGLAESAAEYLNSCEDLAVGALVAWLEKLAGDPTLGEHEEPPLLEIEGKALGIYDLPPAEVVTAAEAVAETDDDELLEKASEYAALDLKNGRESTQFVTLTLDYLCDPTPVVRQRLKEHVERRSTRESDVDGLF
jgi:hypothetical protein